MQCERLIGLAKSWYLHVQDETMAPARMVSFIKDHVQKCAICQEDPDIHDEITKITEIILPKSKIPKAVRLKQEKEAEQAAILSQAFKNTDTDSIDKKGDSITG